VALVIVGDELLRGASRDGNGPWLAGRLQRAGLRVVGLTVTGDAPDRVAEAVARAARSASVVLVSGGLGPTDDDGTREGVARAAEVPLVEDPRALEAVRAAQGARGYELDERRRREARLPEGARVVDNPEGTAPGFVLELGSTRLWAMPGVPREMRAMFEQQILPDLVGPDAGDVAAASFRVAGVREPDAAEMLQDLATDTSFDLGLYPHEGELEVVVTARGTGAERRVREVAGGARERFGESAYDNEPLQVVVVGMLASRGLIVTTAESMSGGQVARLLTSVPGASEVFRGGWVTYSDAWKAGGLGVDEGLLERHGAVSAEVVQAMAEGALARAEADLAVSVTGIAGPEDGRDPRGDVIAQGTWYLALARRDGASVVEKHRSPLSRGAVQHRAAVTALDLLRRTLLKPRTVG
jgi:nicotinamide-nucleotide amidase